MNVYKSRLMEKLERLGLNEKNLGYRPPLPLVSLEEFFEGNSDEESIAVNLLSPDPKSNMHPGLAYFYATLKEIRSRSDVQNVLVEIFEIETALSNESAWPYAEKVFFYTSAHLDEIERWNTLLRADGPLEYNPDNNHHVNEPPIRSGYKIWYVIWD